MPLQHFHLKAIKEGETWFVRLFLPISKKGRVVKGLRRENAYLNYVR